MPAAIAAIVAGEMMYRLPVALALAVAALPSQDPATDDATRLLARLRASGVQRLVEHFPQTRLGKLAADPDVAEAVDRLLANESMQRRRGRAVTALAAELEVELEPWMIGNLYTNTDLSRLFEFPLPQVRALELSARLRGEAQEAMFRAPDTSILVACTPRHEGRMTQVFEREAQQLERAPWFTRQMDAKIGGFPAYVFTPPESEQNDYQAPGLWMQHLPGTFAYGTGNPDTGIDLARSIAEATAGDGEVAMFMDLQLYMNMFGRMGMGVPTEFAALGFDKLKSLTWSARFQGELLLDQLVLEMTEETPTGLVGALVNGSGTPPAQALPKGAIAQLRTMVEMTELTKSLTALGDDLPLPPMVLEKIAQALDGGAALGICAPMPGGLIPRIHLSLGIADREVLDELLQKLVLGRNRPFKKVRYGDTECTILKIPNLPQGIQPAFCVIDGVLHVAESGRSLRAFLKSQKQDVVAMNVRNAPLPEGPGEQVTSFDLRLDEVELYRAYRNIWLPLFELTNSQSTALRRDDMPPVDLVAEHCGTSRGALFKDGRRFVVRHLGALGGPEMAAVAMTYGPILTANSGNYAVDQIAYLVASHKLQAVYEQFEKFEQREQRRPKDLAELFAAQQLADDALLMPVDDLAEQFTLPDGRKLRTSFRYFPETVEVTNFNGDTDMILVEIRPHSYNRACLSSSGSTPEIYGEDSSKPIDRLGK